MKYLVYLSLLINLLSCAPEYLSIPLGKPGILDASDVKIKENQLISLENPWAYRLKTFASVESFQDSGLPSTGDFSESWDFVGESSAFMGVTAYAHITLPLKGKTWGFLLPDFFSAYRMTVNGQVVAEVGEPSLNRRFQQAEVHPETAFVYVPGDKMEILIHSSNFSALTMGFRDAIYLGLEESVSQIRVTKLAYDSLIIGILLIMGLLHGVYFFLYPPEEYTIWFGLLSLVVAFRMLLTDTRILVLFTHMPFSLESDLEYATVMLLVMILGRFLQTLFPKVLPSWAFIMVYGLNGLLLLPIPFLSIPDFANLFTLYPIILGISFSVYLWCLVRAFFQKREGAIFFLFEVFLLGVVGFSDLYVSLCNWGGISFHLPQVVIIVVVLQAFWISRRREKSIILLEKNNQRLREIETKQSLLLKSTSQELLPKVQIITKYINSLESESSQLPLIPRRLYFLLKKSHIRLENLSGALKSYQSLKDATGEQELYQLNITDVISSMAREFDPMLRDRIILYQSTKGLLTSAEPHRFRFALKILLNYFLGLKVGNLIRVETRSWEQDSIVLTVTLCNHWWLDRQISTLFKPFLHQENDKKSSAGSVLDLPLAKEYLNQFGAQLDAENQTAGAQFILTLPKAKVTQPLWRESPSFVTKGYFSQQASLSIQSYFNPSSHEFRFLPQGKYILAVDDEPLNLKLLNHLLKTLNLKFHTATNGYEALDRVAKGGIGLVLLDVMMPVMDGIQALTTLRSTQNRLECPVILVTAKNQISDQRKGLLAGANAYVIKPFNLKALKALIERYIRRLTWQDEFVMGHRPPDIRWHLAFLAPDSLKSEDYPLKGLKIFKASRKITALTPWETTVVQGPSCLARILLDLQDFLRNICALEPDKSWGIGCTRESGSSHNTLARQLAESSQVHGAGIVVTPEISTILRSYPGLIFENLVGCVDAHVLQEEE